jgi:hypothetical protein
MLDERAPGQNTTSKPAPEGMMKVDVWSSKAGDGVSGSLAGDAILHTKTVGVRAHVFHVLRVFAWLAFACRVVLSCAAVFGLVIFRTRRVTRVELRTIDVVVGVRVDAIARLLRG